MAHGRDRNSILMFDTFFQVALIGAASPLLYNPTEYNKEYLQQCNNKKRENEKKKVNYFTLKAHVRATRCLLNSWLG